jgi:hypothetical protein
MCFFDFTLGPSSLHSTSARPSRSCNVLFSNNASFERGSANWKLIRETAHTFHCLQLARSPPTRCKSSVSGKYASASVPFLGRLVANTGELGIDFGVCVLVDCLVQVVRCLLVSKESRYNCRRVNRGKALCPRYLQCYPRRKSLSSRRGLGTTSERGRWL